MRVCDLINLIPNKLFQELAIKTRVDNQVKKLSGELIFKLILFSMLNSEKLSLRIMEEYLHSGQFKLFTGYDILEGRYNSIRDRICSIDASYFEKLFNEIFKLYNKQLNEQHSLSKTDSTMVGLSAKLFQAGMSYGGDNGLSFVKYSLNLKGSLPSSIKVYVDKKYASENAALTELIESTDCIEGNIVVFDRGLQSRESFDSFSKSRKMFVTRHNIKIRVSDCQESEVEQEPTDSTVTILEDKIGYLLDKNHKQTNSKYRIIKAKVKKSGKLTLFVTNILDMGAYEIAALYKLRWEIEVFFKFIKQYLNVKHLVSRNLNGIKVMIFMTMILAILLISYKKLNKHKGFKISKLKFELELDTEIMKAIVLICGGNPDLAPHIFKSG